MKRLTLCAAMLLCSLLYAGCVSPAGTSIPSEPTASKRDNIPFAEHHDYAVAYLGYQEITGLDFYVERYLDHDKIPTHYLSSGDYYLVIPRYSGMELSLFQIDFDTGEEILLFHDPDCQPFLLQCNASDVFADAAVRLTYQGRESGFSPFISLKDGTIDVGANGLDITKDAEAGSGS